MLLLNAARLLFRVYISMFHTQNALVAFIVEMFENIFVIHFAGCWFFAAGVITNLQVTNFFPRCINIVNDISFVCAACDTCRKEICMKGCSPLCTLQKFDRCGEEKDQAYRSMLQAPSPIHAVQKSHTQAQRFYNIGCLKSVERVLP